MPPLKGDEEEKKSKPKETISERVKLNPQKRNKITGTGIKILTPNKLLT